MSWFISWGYILAGGGIIILFAFLMIFDPDGAPVSAIARGGVASIIGIFMLLRGFRNLRKIKKERTQNGQ